jgi:hypothetical protein
VKRRLRLLARYAGVVCLALIAIGIPLGWWYVGGWRTVRRLGEAPAKGRCSRRLDRALIDRSVELGQGFLVRHQKAEGKFDYEYDWRHKTLSAEDNQARQAGALWGLGLLYQDHPTPELGAAIEKGIAFFDRHSVGGADGRRCVAYPGDQIGVTGTTALVALAHVEYLRSARSSLAEGNFRAHADRLDGYLAALAAARNPDGVFHGSYAVGDCRPFGAASSYSDGEALLALVKAAKYLGRSDLVPLCHELARAGYQRNVERALAENRDSDITKGYYQWSSMAFFELCSSGWPDTDRYGDWVLRLADWMIDVHRTLWRGRNTGYAYEGIIHAYEVARRRGDQTRMAKYACVIDTGLERLVSWQLGGPIPSPHLGGEGRDDPRALGGVQNEAFASPLRIDVTQHQTHALLLARRYVYPR